MRKVGQRGAFLCLKCSFACACISFRCFARKLELLCLFFSMRRRHWPHVLMCRIAHALHSAALQSVPPGAWLRKPFFITLSFGYVTVGAPPGLAAQARLHHPLTLSHSRTHQLTLLNRSPWVKQRQNMSETVGSSSWLWWLIAFYLMLCHIVFDLKKLWNRFGVNQEDKEDDEEAACAAAKKMKEREDAEEKERQASHSIPKLYFLSPAGGKLHFDRNCQSIRTSTGIRCLDYCKFCAKKHA
jgi:hypothetical protein